jgi:hypothetical protein
MEWQNSPASLSLSPRLGRPVPEEFLGEVEAADLLPTDRENTITERFKVLRWWKLDWDGEKWVIGEELFNYPQSIGLSPLE